MDPQQPQEAAQIAAFEKEDIHAGAVERLSGCKGNVILKIGDTIVKSYIGDHLGICAEDRYNSEKSALIHLATQSFSFEVPKLLQSNDSDRQLTMSFLNGQPLPLHYLLLKSTNEERSYFVQKAGSVLSEIHSSSATELCEGDLQTYLDDAIQNARQATDVLESEGLSVDLVIERMTSLINKNAVQIGGAAQLHGDYWMNSLVYTDRDITGVIDWEFSAPGSVYRDLGRAQLLVGNRYGTDNAFLDGYNRALDRRTLQGYTLAECIRYLSLTPLPEYQKRKSRDVEFYTNVLRQVQSLYPAE